MPGQVKKYRLRFLKKLRSIIIAGLVVIVPIGVTVWILVWLFEKIDNLLRGYTTRVFGHEVIGVGFGVIIILILVVGLIATNVFGKRMVRWGEDQLSKVPISRTIYVGLKQVFQSFADPEKTGFMQVVMVEHPRKDLYVIGFITNEYVDPMGKKLINVFIPATPNPTTGSLQIVDESQIIRTKLTIEEGLKMVVSAGRVSPAAVGEKLLEAKLKSEAKRNLGSSENK
ncbi:MAG: DUF502 domain-containing protein [Dehalococcoidales bacterium]|nr:DUF502 domain-containing protein [Dehalococcoidales bacterium]